VSLEQRVYAHWKALKHASPLEWVPTIRCESVCEVTGEPTYGHSHGAYKTTTSNAVWLRLAKTHKIPVRQVKDIVTAEREARRED
jgi:hypothetical protein